MDNTTFHVAIISTHVSVRRRTFNADFFAALHAFQLTSPQGDERCIRTVISVCYDFNSRLRKETNVNSSGDVDFGWIFQLTSP